MDASIVDYDASKANVPGHAPMIGERLPAGSTIYLKNTAKLTTSSGDVTDKVGETGLTVEQTGATSQTAKYPTIQKVDVGDAILYINEIPQSLFKSPIIVCIFSTSV